MVDVAQINDMTAREARAAFSEISKKIGVRAEIYGSLASTGYYADNSEISLNASVYPQGMGYEAAFRVHAETWRDLVSTVAAKWAEFSDEHARRLICDMALEVIRITAEQGQCTDAALRAGKFSPGDVARYGTLAAEKANEMASNGPFSIVTVGGNGEHIEDEKAA